MKKSATSLLLLALVSLSSAAMADPWKGGRHSREHKQTYWDGYCKVEQKWKKGEYKEKRKCKRPDARYAERRYDDRRYREHDVERPVVYQGYYPVNSYYYPDDGRHARRDPQVNIDIRIRQ
ncbi:hypothetical protein MasN3_16330 [Massilia varians]|uniref:Uncharacterized protein n=1 Tax=Massilia varians TaxID=457921 RepID=A0ABM8C4J6_9BURK|nr:hypothetical protein [Massilia varians]BDT58139.1 hypothetical protein MasN3_16330 [Massilia varians]